MIQRVQTWRSNQDWKSFFDFWTNLMAYWGAIQLIITSLIKICKNSFIVQFLEQNVIPIMQNRLKIYIKFLAKIRCTTINLQKSIICAAGVYKYLKMNFWLSFRFKNEFLMSWNLNILHVYIILIEHIQAEA